MIGCCRAKSWYNFDGTVVPQQEVLGDEDVVHDRPPLNKKTPPFAAKRNGGAGTEKRPMTLIIAGFQVLSSSAAQIFSVYLSRQGPRKLTRFRGHASPFSQTPRANTIGASSACPDLDDYMRVCEEAVRAGGQVVQDWAGRFDVREKGPADLVTQADFASQEVVRKTVLTAFPDHRLLGEETGNCPNFRGHRGEAVRDENGAVPSDAAQPTGTAVPHSQYRWIVDPLDGTTNYVHGVPHYCVSLALERNGGLLVGAVYDPILGECFTAIEGRGARLNGRPIHASGVAALSEALAAVGFAPNSQADAPDVHVFLEMLPRCQAIRRTGSSALNLCYLAAGRFDLYWSYSTRIWDVAAGVLIVREAGGCVTSPNGGEFSLEEAHFLAAATPKLHARLVELAAMPNRQGKSEE